MSQLALSGDQRPQKGIWNDMKTFGRQLMLGPGVVAAEIGQETALMAANVNRSTSLEVAGINQQTAIGTAIINSITSLEVAGINQQTAIGTALINKTTSLEVAGIHRQTALETTLVVHFSKGWIKLRWTPSPRSFLG
jgi:hypothetical protein